METKEKNSATRRVKKEVSKTPKVEEVKEKAINEELKSLLLKSGLQTSDIEDKYYCELLAEAAGNADKNN